MDTKTTCEHCGKVLGPEAIEGLCPDCLMKMGLGIGTEASGVASQGKHVFTPPTPADLASKFPQFEILAFIGQGGMGAVYKARQRQLDRFVALKILPPGIGKDPAFADRFAREAKAMAKLNHAGIVTIYDFGCADGLYYLTMEFVDGVSLRQLMHAGRVSPREALAIVPQICDALQYAHDQGIVHRDIKPENILLDRRGRVKVADFGLAKLIGAENEPTVGGAATISSSLTEVGKVMGTPHYMAPEQVGDPGAVDHRADIYALGVVFYQMLTGELPSKPIAPPSRKVRIDVRLDDVVLRALEKEPEHRYQHVSQVKTAVESITQTSTLDKRENESRTGWVAVSRSASTAMQRFRGRLLAGVVALLVIWFISYMVMRTRASRIEAEMERSHAVEKQKAHITPAQVFAETQMEAVAIPTQVFEAPTAQLHMEWVLDVPTPTQVFEAVAREGDIGVYIDSLGSVESSNSVAFNIPEGAVQEVVRRFNGREQLSVEAYDRSKARFGEGALVAVDNQIDTATGTLKCKASLTPENDNLMVPGLFLNVRLRLGVRHGATLVPDEAILREDQSAYVWVINSDQTVTRRPVQTGTTEGQIVEIKNGLSPGELVVRGSKDTAAMREGQKVTAEPAKARFYYVGGQVVFPARRAFQPGLTVTAAIKACGGFTAEAIKEKAQLTREGSNAPMVIDITAIEQGKAPDPEIMPGDQLLVLTAPRNGH